MKLLYIALILFTFTKLGFSQGKSYQYLFEVDTILYDSNKSFLSDFTNHINYQSRHTISQNSFKLISKENYSEEFFFQIALNYGINLKSFQKTKIFVEYNLAEKNGGQDCSEAAMLCNNSSISGNSNGAGNQELNSSNDGCLSGEHQSSWYYVNVGSDGTLEMEIDPIANDDYDWAIWGPFDETTANANCPPTAQPIRCSFAGTSDPTGMGDYWGVVSTYTYPCGWFNLFTCTGENWGWVTASDNSEGSGGNGWTSPLNVLEDEVYIMVIDNWSASGDPFDLNWGGSAGLDCTTVPLPVELISFEVNQNKELNEISWTTASETNNAHFILEYSADGHNWKEIEKIQGAGNSNSENTYLTYHRDYENGINYYRLKQVDYDGTINTHNIISIDNTGGRVLLKKVNSMGQEVNDNYKGMVIEYYEDGSTRKVMQ